MPAVSQRLDKTISCAEDGSESIKPPGALRCSDEPGAFLAWPACWGSV
ncbi:hypothetical protein KR100_10555 [Synechococcus sp. KORDI-100]|nr:hypothetical protein KR100_10555 [Synechococcus sp. KORDI-100]